VEYKATLYNSELTTTASIFLYWWALNTAKRTINTAITRQGFENFMTKCAFIKILASICRHYLFFLNAAFRAGDDRF